MFGGVHTIQVDGSLNGSRARVRIGRKGGQINRQVAVGNLTRHKYADPVDVVGETVIIGAGFALGHDVKPLVHHSRIDMNAAPVTGAGVPQVAQVGVGVGVLVGIGHIAELPAAAVDPDVSIPH